MKITYDRKADAIYISITTVISKEPYITYPCNPVEVGGQINLDFNNSGQLVGIEILDASKKLPKEFFLDAVDIE